MMQNFYIKIDLEYLQTLSPSIKQRLEQLLVEKFPEKQGYCNFLRLCPYCNKFTLLSLPDQKIVDSGFPKRCAICGETDPFEKIRISSDKANVLDQLALYCSMHDDSTEEEIQNEKTVVEQGIVVMATGLEIFFRDIYSSGMNIKFVKSKHTLFLKFSNESKNDFINIEKTLKRFKSGLDIDLKKVLDKNEIEIIHELFLKRNAIVHNNGFVDSIFLNQSGIDCKIGDPIPITDEDVTKYSHTIAKIVNKIEIEFEKIISPEILIRIEDF